MRGSCFYHSLDLSAAIIHWKTRVQAAIWSNLHLDFFSHEAKVKPPAGRPVSKNVYQKNPPEFGLVSSSLNFCPWPYCSVRFWQSPPDSMYLKRKEKKRTLMAVASRAVVSRSTFFYNSLASVVGSEKQPWMQWPWDERGERNKGLEEERSRRS